jgi:hypothetical protein
MTGLDVARLLEGQLIRIGVLLGVDRLEQKADMIPEIELFQNRAREPTLAGVEYRNAVRQVPVHPSKLVHFIACLSAKELGDVLIFFFDDVHREEGGSVCK